MTDEQIRLYAIARCVAPAGTRIRTISEPAAGGILYTLEMKKPKTTLERWFGVHSSTLRSNISDGVLAGEIRRAIEGSPPHRRKS